jgi:geranylgeranyl pyrophosphate synthase
MAMNQAGLIRSFVHQYIHRDSKLTTAEKLGLLRIIDDTIVSLCTGQAIDIAWHEHWYGTHIDFPYTEMVIRKTASLFSCSAAMGAFIATGDSRVVDECSKIATSFGIVFQKIDDYLDFFVDSSITGKTPYNDLREGKVTYPVMVLMKCLKEAGSPTDAIRFLEVLGNPASGAADWAWVVRLMESHRVDSFIREDVDRELDYLAAHVDVLGTNVSARKNLRDLILVLQHASWR